MSAERRACLCCLHPDAVAMKIDRKGRPYLTCGWCGTRTFVRDAEGLRGHFVLAPTLDAAKLAEMRAHTDEEALARLWGAGDAGSAPT